MKKKEILIICLILCFLCSLQAIAASDLDNTNLGATQDDVVSIDNVSANSLSATDDNLQSSLNEKSFSFLQDMIDGNTYEANFASYNYTNGGSEGQITISKTITLDGQGKVIIDAKHVSRIFYITNKDATITLKGITFINGNATDGNGGAIYSDGTLSLNNCKFFNNTAATEGGAIYIDAGVGDVRNLEFRSNHAGHDGGAIYFAHESATTEHDGLHNGIFIDNTAGVEGGALYLQGNDGAIHNATFTNNVAYKDGGAIMINGTDWNVTDSTFSYNTATTGNGGGIYLEHSTSSIVLNCTFTNNTAGRNGGGVDWHKGAANGQLLNSTFTNNIANRSGGAVYWYGHDGTILNSIFTNNTAKGNVFGPDSYGNDTWGGHGGAIIWVGSDGYVYNCTFTENSAYGHDVGEGVVDGGKGGAVYLQGSSDSLCNNTKFDNCTFVSNYAQVNGGAIDWYAGARNGLVNNSIFTNNIANRSGGAIFWSGKNGNITHSIFTNNIANGSVPANDSYGNITYGGNGGAVMWVGSEGYVYNCTFNENKAYGHEDDEGVVEGGKGGAVYLQGSSIGGCNNTKFDNCIFESNYADVNGGAVDWYVGAMNGLVNNSTFTNNIANRSGGAVFWSGINGSIYNSVFTNNNALGNNKAIDSYGNVTSGGHGGAVMWVGPIGDVHNSTFTDNTAAKHGGAVYLQGGSKNGDCNNTTFYNCTFTNNIAGWNGGAIDWHEGAHYGLVNLSTFTNNTAKSNGGAIFWEGHDGEILNSNFTNNNASGEVKDAENDQGDGGAVIWAGTNGNVDNCNFINNTAVGRGGAVYLHNCFEHGMNNNTTFHNCNFINNTAGINGGALDWHEGAHYGLVNLSTFTNNTARRNGGAIYWNGENGQILDSTFTNNRATGKKWEYDMVFNMDTDIIVNNTSNVLPEITDEYRGKLYVINLTSNSVAHFESWVVNKSDVWEKLDEIDIEISESIISPADWAIDQYFGGDGGTILWSGDVGLVYNCTFIDSNSARRGGGAYMTGSDNITFDNCTFINCTSGTNGGGVDWLAGANYGRIYNCVFNHTQAARSAGAIYYDGWYGDMQNITIINTISHGGDPTFKYSKDGLVTYAGWDSSHWDTNTTGGDAGAIMFTGSNIDVYNVTFTNCIGNGRGGAVFLQDNHNVTFILCTFDNNTAKGCSTNTWDDDKHPTPETLNTALTGHGGAIGFDVGARDCKIENSTFKHNMAEHLGGAISYGKGSSFGSIINSTFENNTAKRSGGAISFDGTNCTVYNSTFINNRAIGTNPEYTLTVIMNGTDANIKLVTELPTTLEAGKLYVVNQTIEGGKIAHFESWVNDNGNRKKLDEINITISESIISPIDWAIDQYFGGDGGTILWSGDNGTVFNCTFIDSNSARRGGGAYMTGSDNITFDNCTFINCTSGTNGGGVDWLAGANYGRIYNCVFNHTQAARSAGAIYYDGWYGDMQNITIINTIAHGGEAEFLTSKGDLITYAGWDSSHWDTNTTGGDAGAIMFTGSNINVYNITFKNCIAAGRGGAVFLQDNRNVTFDSCWFENNLANGTAKNTWNDDKNPTDDTFNPWLTGYGGAIAYDVGATIGLIKKSTFINNTAVRIGGAISYGKGSKLGSVEDSVFENNTAMRSGGAISFDGVNCTVYNSNFTNNSALGIDINRDVFDLTNQSNQIKNATVLEDWADHGCIYVLIGMNGTTRANYTMYVYDNDTDKWKPLEFTTETGPSAIDWTVDEYFGGDGGTIFWRGDNGTVDNCIFIDSNSARRGGGAYMTGSDNITFSNCKFINCTSGTNGGGLDWLAGANGGAVINSTFENTRAARSAGAIYYDGDSGRMINLTIINTTSHGGLDIFTSDDGRVTYATWDSSHWDYNTTGGDAGAIMITGSDEYLYNVTAINCTTVGRGGVVFLQDNHNVTFELCWFENNTALGTAQNTWETNITQNANETTLAKLTGHGGAVAFDLNAENCTIEKSTFINNFARRNGVLLTSTSIQITTLLDIPHLKTTPFGTMVVLLTLTTIQITVQYITVHLQTTLL